MKGMEMPSNAVLSDNKEEQRAVHFSDEVVEGVVRIEGEKNEYLSQEYIEGLLRDSLERATSLAEIVNSMRAAVLNQQRRQDLQFVLENGMEGISLDTWIENKILEISQIEKECFDLPFEALKDELENGGINDVIDGFPAKVNVPQDDLGRDFLEKTDVYLGKELPSWSSWNIDLIDAVDFYNDLWKLSHDPYIVRDILHSLVLAFGSSQHSYLFKKNVKKLIEIEPQKRNEVLSLVKSREFLNMDDAEKFIDDLGSLSSEERIEFQKFFDVGIAPRKKEALDIFLSLRSRSESSGEGDFSRLLSDFHTISDRFSSSKSTEIRMLSKELAICLLDSDDLNAYAEKVEGIFLKGNIPITGKIFKTFELLYPDDKFRGSFREFSSPVLTSYKNLDHRRLILFKDLLRVHLDSSNSNLEQYLGMMKNGADVLEKYERNKHLDSGEMSYLRLFLNRTRALSGNPQKQQDPFERDGEEDVSRAISNLRGSLGVRDGQSVKERIEEVFLKGVGIDNIEGALAYMERKKRLADERNRLLVRNGSIAIESGDLIKGFNSQFLENQLNLGFVSPEFIGAESSSAKYKAGKGDMTPWDTDLERASGNSIPEMMRDSLLANGYGDFLLLLKNRGQFNETRIGKRTIDNGRMELFESGARKPGHMGIRTGFGSTEVSALIENGNIDNQIAKCAIAQKGFYIPIFDRDGNIVFSPNEFDEYRRRFFDVSLDQAKSLRDRLDLLMARNDHTPEDILSVLESDSREIWGSDVGVGEGYTLGEHTKMMMGQYWKYFRKDFSGDGYIDRNFMGVILALHDVGKPFAVLNGDKTLQHKYTKDIFEATLWKFGYSPDQINAAIALVDGDPIGEYMQGKDLESAVSEMSEMSQKSGMTSRDFWEILKVFYMADAGSYTEDAGGKKSLDDMFIFSPEEGKMIFSPFYEGKIHELEVAFLENLDK